jgi:hypothetical protein
MIWTSKARNFWVLFTLDQQRRSLFVAGLLRGPIVFDSTKAPCTGQVGAAQVIATQEISDLFALEAVL